MTTLRDLLTSPVTAVVTVLAFIGSLTGILPALAHALWVTVPTWYPALAVTSSVVLPKLGPVALPVLGVVDIVSIAQSATAIGAVLFVARLADKGIEKITQSLEER